MSIIYKYKFWEWLLELPRREHAKFKAEVAAYVGVTRSTINNWFDMEVDAKHDVPFTAVLYISQRLGKKLEDARNYKPGHELKVASLIADPNAAVLKRVGLKKPNR